MCVHGSVLLQRLHQYHIIFITLHISGGCLRQKRPDGGVPYNLHNSQVVASDKTSLMVEVLRKELDKFVSIKEKFVDEFSLEDFEYIDEVIKEDFWR